MDGRIVSHPVIPFLRFCFLGHRHPTDRIAIIIDIRSAHRLLCTPSHPVYHAMPCHAPLPRRERRDDSQTRSLKTKKGPAEARASERGPLTGPFVPHHTTAWRRRQPTNRSCRVVARASASLIPAALRQTQLSSTTPCAEHRRSADTRDTHGAALAGERRSSGLDEARPGLWICRCANLHARGSTGRVASGWESFFFFLFLSLSLT